MLLGYLRDPDQRSITLYGNRCVSILELSTGLFGRVKCKRVIVPNLPLKMVFDDKCHFVPAPRVRKEKIF